MGKKKRIILGKDAYSYIVRMNNRLATKVVKYSKVHNQSINSLINSFIESGVRDLEKKEKVV